MKRVGSIKGGSVASTLYAPHEAVYTTEHMIIDGQAIAAEILADVEAEIAKLGVSPRLTVFTCQPNFETKKFLALKEKRAKEVGVIMTVIEFDEEVTVSEIILAVESAQLSSEGIIIQLPFPSRIDMDEVLPVLSPSHDVDALTYDGTDTGVWPPVVGAIDEIVQKYEIEFVGKEVVIVGSGRLVGVPAALYARRAGSQVTLVTKDTTETEMKTALKQADILILGAGVPGLIKVDMVQEGVVVFDAGTSEEGGMLVGDASPEVANKASFITPVPGGIGPITVAVLLRNLLRLAARQ